MTPQPDYIIFTGDAPPHDLWKQNKTYNIDMVELTINLFKKYVNKNIRLLTTLGNHAAFPVNYEPGSPYSDSL